MLRSTHVVQEYFSPAVQHPLSVSKLVRWHTTPLLSAIHHLCTALPGLNRALQQLHCVHTCSPWLTAQADVMSSPCILPPNVSTLTCPGLCSRMFGSLPVCLCTLHTSL